MASKTPLQDELRKTLRRLGVQSTGALARAAGRPGEASGVRAALRALEARGVVGCAPGPGGSLLWGARTQACQDAVDATLTTTTDPTSYQNFAWDLVAAGHGKREVAAAWLLAKAAGTPGADLVQPPTER